MPKMKRRIGLLAAFAVAFVVLASIQTSPVAADVQSVPSFGVEVTDYPTTISPGASYTIAVSVSRPEGMPLPSWASGDSPPKWEIRTYFYDGLNAYSEGEMTDIGGTKLYTGWWDHRVQGDSWTATMTDTRNFDIPNKIVSYPRAADEITDGKMNEIPFGEEVKLKVKLRLRWGDSQLQFKNIDNDEENELTFTYYGVEYGGDYTEIKANVKYRVGSVYLEKSEGNYWQIDYETIKQGILVSGSAGGLPIELIGGGVVALVAVGAIIGFMKKRGGGEAKYEEYSQPAQAPSMALPPTTYQMPTQAPTPTYQQAPTQAYPQVPAQATPQAPPQTYQVPTQAPPQAPQQAQQSAQPQQPEAKKKKEKDDFDF